MYCERCRRLVDGDVCPECGKPCKRDVRPDDLCLLLTGGQIWVDMACQVLDQGRVPYLKQGALGAAMTAIAGLAVETYQLYVLYQDYERAGELTAGIVPTPGETLEDVLPGEDPETEQEEQEEQE